MAMWMDNSIKEWKEREREGNVMLAGSTSFERYFLLTLVNPISSPSSILGIVTLPWLTKL